MPEKYCKSVVVRIFKWMPSCDSDGSSVKMGGRGGGVKGRKMDEFIPEKKNA